ncbi:MAG TPA: hypothetical protein VNZ22_11870 [Bacillota bacterium]|nr:hypothetical protein [Bacillota bacterium]
MALAQALRSGFGSLRDKFAGGSARAPQPEDQTPIDAPEGVGPETAAYFRSLATGCAEADLVDDRTWADLEMDRVFQRLNRSRTAPGAQYLYALLRHFPSGQKVREETVKATRAFAANPQAGEALRRALGGAGKGDELAAFLLGAPPAIPANYRLFSWVSAAALLCPFGMLFSPWFLLPATLLWMLSIVLHCVYHRQVATSGPALTSLAKLLSCVPQLPQALPGLGLPEEQELRVLTETARKTQRQISMTFLSRAASNDLLQAAVEYLNVLCLFELKAHCRALLAVNQEWDALLKLYRLVGRLDALQGLGAALVEYPVTCTAEITAGRSFTLVDVYHPLLANPVCNSLQGSGHSLLFTGTNMAGKTTFIKTVGINLLLAQTLGMCLARKAVLPAARLRTLIHREDTLLQGHSYFYAEARELLRMLEQARRNGQEYWLVIDEVFRGTNTLERVASAGAVLRHLAHHALVLASTHDHELTTLLSAQFDAYHFSEVIEGQKARFDYRLKPGPCTTRNAIKLLAIAGYPKEVIEVAETLVCSAEGRGR